MSKKGPMITNWNQAYFAKVSGCGLQGRSQWGTTPIMGFFQAFKSESILPIQPLEKYDEMSLYDLQIVGVWV
jgi:hypothetical protein